MEYSLTEHIKKTGSRRIDHFFSICFPVCDFVEEQHSKGNVLKKLNPDIIYIDFQNEIVELKNHSTRTDEFLPYIAPE